MLILLNSLQLNPYNINSLTPDDISMKKDPAHLFRYGM